jgi:hypothetical protein
MRRGLSVRIGAELIRRLGLALAGLALAALALIALGAGVGRFHVVPVDGHGRGVAAPTAAVAIVAPAPTPTVRSGDVVAARTGNDTTDALYKVAAVDSWSHKIYATDRTGKLVELKLGAQVGRVERFVPYVGAAYRSFAGTIGGLVLLTLAVSLLVNALRVRGAMFSPLHLRIRRLSHALPGGEARDLRWRARLVAMLRVEVAYATRPNMPKRRFRGPWFWGRFAAATVWAMGVLALTAGASFSGSSSVNQGSITTGHMALTVPSACVAAANSCAANANNRLTLGATDIAPGDRMQRALDLSVDDTTTSGLMSGLTLRVTASPSSVLDTDTTNGLRIFVQECRTSSGATGWTEAGTSPAFTYSCAKGGGGAWNDLLNSSPTDDPTSVPSAGTCASSNGGTGSYRAVSELSSPFTLVNLPTLSASTQLHLVVTVCFPTAADDTFQDVTSTLTFTFAGVQRPGTDK